MCLKISISSISPKWRNISLWALSRTWLHAFRPCTLHSILPKWSMPGMIPNFDFMSTAHSSEASFLLGRGMAMKICLVFFSCLTTTALPRMQFLLSGESIHPEGQAQEKKSGPDDESKQRWLQGDDAQELIPERKINLLATVSNTGSWKAIQCYWKCQLCTKSSSVFPWNSISSYLQESYAIQYTYNINLTVKPAILSYWSFHFPSTKICQIPFPNFVIWKACYL